MDSAQKSSSETKAPKMTTKKGSKPLQPGKTSEGPKLDIKKTPKYARVVDSDESDSGESDLGGDDLDPSDHSARIQYPIRHGLYGEQYAWSGVGAPNDPRKVFFHASLHVAFTNIS
jgi:hypothetical protein